MRLALRFFFEQLFHRLLWWRYIVFFIGHSLYILNFAGVVAP